tara:strand:+ start:650 stop:943 length:294 start_codon:yes stop_codon:yes gene_type:complete
MEKITLSAADFERMDVTGWDRGYHEDWLDHRDMNKSIPMLSNTDTRLYICSRLPRYGGFAKALARAIVLADDGNLRRIAIAFYDLIIQAYESEGLYD